LNEFEGNAVDEHIDHALAGIINWK
jgi:hypothetical protein